jgi:hypothetical protein
VNFRTLLVSLLVFFLAFSPAHAAHLLKIGQIVPLAKTHTESFPTNFSDPSGLFLSGAVSAAEAGLVAAAAYAERQAIYAATRQVLIRATIGAAAAKEVLGPILGPSPEGGPNAPINPTANVTESPSPNSDTIYRQGDSWESRNRLQIKSEEAQNAIGIFGVSLNKNQKYPNDSVSTVQTLNAAGFKIIKTGRDPGHYTLEFQNPLTPEQVNAFNTCFGRRKR